MAKLKYVPVPEKENHNISKVNPWFKLGKYAVYSSLILLVLFIITLLLGRILIPFVSLEQEQKWFSDDQMFEAFGDSDPRLSKEVQKIIDTLDQTNPDRFAYQAIVICNEEMNALTSLGGRIYVFDGLLKSVASENELSFVLAHEISHVKNRDVLQKAVTEFPFAVISLLLADAPVRPLKDILASGYDKNVELRSDREALAMLNQKYGHVSGAKEFFERTKGKGFEEMMKVFSDHPLSATRIKRLAEQLQNYSTGETSPLGFSPEAKCRGEN